MTRHLHILLLAASLLLAGCATWTPGWEEPPGPAPDVGAAHDAEAARAALRDAADGAQIDAAIADLEAALATAPDHAALGLDLADAHILRGAAYTQGRRNKRNEFRRGIRHAEQIMGRNAEFRARVDAGQPIGEAASALGEDELRAMVLWVTGVFYYFREGLNPLQRVLQFDRLEQTRPVLEHALALDPEYEHGVLPFSLAIYYIAVPGFAGRDFDFADELLDQAIAVPGTSLLPQWGRAKYLHVARGDRDAFRRDLEWVVAQDPRAADSPYYWNVFIQRSARDLLDRMNEPF